MIVHGLPILLLSIATTQPIVRGDGEWIAASAPEALLVLLEQAGGDLSYRLSLERLKLDAGASAAPRMDVSWMADGPPPGRAGAEWSSFPGFSDWLAKAYPVASAQGGLEVRQFAAYMRVAQSTDGRFAQEPCVADSGLMSLYEEPGFFLTYSAATRQAMCGPDTGTYMRFDLTQVFSPLPIGQEVRRRFAQVDWSESPQRTCGSVTRILRGVSHAPGLDYETRIVLDEFSRPIAAWARVGGGLAVANAWQYAGPLAEDQAGLVPTDSIRVDLTDTVIQAQRFALEEARSGLKGDDLTIELPVGALLTEHTSAGVTIKGRAPSKWPDKVLRAARRPIQGEALPPESAPRTVAGGGTTAREISLTPGLTIGALVIGLALLLTGLRRWRALERTPV